MSRYVFSHDTGLKEFIELQFFGCYEKTPYAKRIADKILNVFPKRITEKELAGEINISVKWLQHECKKAFNVTYLQFARIIRVYTATKLFYITNLNNKDIAAELYYTKESNMARDFRKVLNISPEETRIALLLNTPTELFANI